jgi:hypothetical protein
MRRGISLFDPDDDSNLANLWCDEPGAAIAAVVARIRRASVCELVVIHRAVGERLAEMETKAQPKLIVTFLDRGVH